MVTRGLTHVCQCDERPKTKIWGIYTSRIHWVVKGTGTPKDGDEVIRRDVFECMCELWSWHLLWIRKTRAKDKTYIWVSVRWKTKNEIWEIYTSLIHWVVRGTWTPKDRDEVNTRDVCECDGWVCVPEVIGVPSRVSVIRKTASLTSTLRWTRSVSRWICTSDSLMNSLCDLPDVLSITDIKKTEVGGLWL